MNNSQNIRGAKGLCCCLMSIMVIGLLFILGIVLFLSKPMSGNDNYDGSRAAYSQAEQKEMDAMYVKDLKKVGVSLSVDDRNSVDVEAVLKKIDSSKKLTKNEKITLTSHLAKFMSVYYVDNNQEKINSYVQELRNDINSGTLEKNKNNKQYLLKHFYMSQIVDSSISKINKNENMIKIDNFAFDYLQTTANLYRETKDWNSDFIQANIDQLNRGSNEVEIPKIDD